MAFTRSALIIIASHALHLTVLALVRFCETGTGRMLSSTPRKIAAKPSLATSRNRAYCVRIRFKGESWELFGPIMSGEKNS
jgi:hypothetical protein